MNTKKEISQLEDVKLLVDEFYAKVRQDDLLKDIFEERLGDEWTAHLQNMYRFWQTLLLNEYTYSGSPSMKHMNLPIHQPHFDRWLALFHATIDQYFTGEKAEEAKVRAERMAMMFQAKLASYRNSGNQGLM